MHCATCEAFIETVATQTEGVSAASASYVTDTVRIDHDPDAVSTDDLSEAVSGLGYSAYDRDDAFSRRQADMATTRGSRLACSSGWRLCSSTSSSSTRRTSRSPSTTSAP